MSTNERLSNNSFGPNRTYQFGPSKLMLVSRRQPLAVVIMSRVHNRALLLVRVTPLCAMRYYGILPIVHCRPCIAYGVPLRAHTKACTLLAIQFSRSAPYLVRFGFRHNIRFRVRLHVAPVLLIASYIIHCAPWDAPPLASCSVNRCHSHGPLCFSIPLTMGIL